MAAIILQNPSKSYFFCSVFEKVPVMHSLMNLYASLGREAPPAPTLEKKLSRPSQSAIKNLNYTETFPKP
jgi:hypothetical protein